MLMAMAEKAMRGLTNSVDKLCKWFDVVEGAVSALKYDMHDLKGKASMDDTEIVMQAEVMKALKNTLYPINTLMRSMEITNEGVDEETTEMKQAMEESLREAYSQGGGGECGTAIELCEDDISDKATTSCNDSPGNF